MSILAYHMVDDRFDWGVTKVTPRQFEKQIKTALEAGFRFFNLEDYFKENGPKKVAITFDDGYESVYQYAFPILKKYGVTATVFVIPGYCGQFNTWDVNIGGIRFKHLSWQQIKDLKSAGWEIGSHSFLHRDLSVLSTDQLFKDLLSAEKILKYHISDFSSVISYPFGNTNEKVIQVCKQLGFKNGVVMGRVSKNWDPCFSQTRLGVYLLDTEFTFLNKLNHHNWLFHNMQKVMDFCSDGSVIVKKRSWY